MSYLELPRIHFGGLFFTDPTVINNTTANYTPSVNLKTPDGLYDLLKTGWSTTGVSQFWIENCEVLSVVGADGRVVTSSAEDKLVGAAVESPSPTTPQSDGGSGYYGIAKMVDLDPDQQGRTEIWGFRIFVKIPGGGGFSGRWEVPNLRNIFNTGDGGFDGYMQPVSGIWHSRISDIVWDTASADSTVLTALQQATQGDALDMKWTIGLYQRDRRHDLAEVDRGNKFGYGRVMATIGPVGQDDPVQIVPGRRLYSPSMFASNTKRVEANPKDADGNRLDVKEAVGRLLAQGDPSSPTWGITDCKVYTDAGGKTRLSIDLGESIPHSPDGHGTLEVPGPITVGLKSGLTLTNGTIEIGSSDYVKVAAALERKDTFWLPNSGVYDIELAGDEAQQIAGSPLEVRLAVPGTSAPVAVLQEAPDGMFLAIEPAAIRMQPNETNSECTLTAYQWGDPMTSLPDTLEIAASVYQWEDTSDVENAKSAVLPTTEISFTVGQESVAKGKFPVIARTSGTVTLPPIRQPLDSQQCFGDIQISVDGKEQPVLSDHTDPLSVLFWQNHTVVENANWENGLGAILENYARIYPGMKGRLDIGDKDTVRGFCNVILALVSEPIDDPSYMPVMRDMSPDAMDMLRAWLQKTLEEMQNED